MSPSKYAVRLCNVKRKDRQGPVTVEDILSAGRMITNIRENEANKMAVTLAKQGVDNMIATISYTKKNKVKTAFSKSSNGSLPIEWDSCDEGFLEMTILQDPEDANMDICAVHGLNGNAFDTWFCEDKGIMWLRDLLPRDESFNKSRIMIFGYSSELRSNATASDRDYADSLLRQLKWVRDCLRDRDRPLIIVAHSMGGLVSRLAMSRLQSLPRKFGSVPVPLNQCGLLFLSTPHYGSKQADWDAFWVRLGKVAAGIRTEIVDYLRTFSSSIVEVMDVWNEMAEKPVIRCLCEADKTTVYLNYGVEVVTPPSAGFLGHTAEKVLRTDHHTICKFKSAHEMPYERVKDNLQYIKAELARRKAEEQYAERNIVRQIGEPPLEPGRTPLSPTKKYFYLGRQGSRNPSQLVGQSEIIEDIYDYLQGSSGTPPGRRFVCLYGVGGSGKTEITYEVARRHRDRHSVFMLHASDRDQLQDSYTGLSFIIGHDSLVHRYTRYQEAHRVWESLDRTGRIEAIRQWLDCDENADSVLIFDDIDGLGDRDAIQQSLPSMSKSLVFSTRNPVLPETPELKALSIAVPRLTIRDSETLLRRELGEDSNITDEEIYRIIAIACHHPLTILVFAHLIRHKPKLVYNTALGYSTAVGWLVGTMNKGDWETRKEILNLNVPGPLSLLQLYERSLERLPTSELRKGITQFTTAIAFISPPLGSSTRTPILQFFQERRWLNAQWEPNDFPDREILNLSLARLSEILSAMNGVSLLDDSPSNDGSFIHPIWLECARHLCTKDERISWLRQLLLICFANSSMEGIDSTWKLYLENILTHTRVSDFTFADLNLPAPAQEWLNSQIRTQLRLPGEMDWQ